MFEIKVQSSFDAAHFLEGTGTKCDGFHGHTWNVWVILSSEKLHSKGWVINFTLVKKWLKEILEEFDHSILNFYLYQPTAENLCYVIFRHIHSRVGNYNTDQGMNINVKKVEIAETPDNVASYSCYDVYIRSESAKMAGRKLRGRKHSKKWKEKIGNALRGRKTGPISDERKKILSDSYNHEKHSEAMKLKWQNPDFRENQIKAIVRAFKFKLNKSEEKLMVILDKFLPNEYKFVGDGQVIIGGKLPDFVNVNGQKKIIELFGDYWHSKKIIGRTKIEEENQRINHFAKYGYQTLIVWEHELENIDKLKRKLLSFNRKSK